MLAARALSVREVRERLARRGYGRDEIESAVASLISQGYLDDTTLAYNVAASRAQQRFGKIRVTALLGRRGVAPEIVTEAVHRVFADLDEDELAREAAEEAARRQSGPRDHRWTARIGRSLLRRGFSRGAVTTALRRMGSFGGGRPGADPSGSEDDEPDFETDS